MSAEEIAAGLRQVAAEYAEDRARADATNARRMALIRHAVAEGIPKAEVARIVGVGKARVGQIVEAG